MLCMNLQRKGEETKYILKTEYNIMTNRDRFKVTLVNFRTWMKTKVNTEMEESRVGLCLSDIL